MDMGTGDVGVVFVGRHDVYDKTAGISDFGNQEVVERDRW